MNNKFKTEMDVYKDSTIKFETNNVFEAAIDWTLIPILNSLPSSLRGVVKKTHKSAEGVIDNATTHKALEILYSNGYFNGAGKSLMEKIFHKIWFNTNNSKAVRNRLRIAKKEIYKAADKLIKDGEDLNILSIASGSARAVLEVINMLDVPQGQNVSVTFLDKDPAAIRYSKKLATELKIPVNFNLNWVGQIEPYANRPIREKRFRFHNGTKISSRDPRHTRKRDTFYATATQGNGASYGIRLNP